MSERNTLFEAAFPYGDDILALPVTDLSQAAVWYAQNFGLQEVERRDSPHPTVILERDGVRFGFAINGLDPGNEGAAIRVNDIQLAKQEFAHLPPRSGPEVHLDIGREDCDPVAGDAWGGIHGNFLELWQP